MSHALCKYWKTSHFYSTTSTLYLLSPFLSNGILETESSPGLLIVILLDILFSFRTGKEQFWKAQSSCSGLKCLWRNRHTFCKLPGRLEKKLSAENWYKHWQVTGDWILTELNTPLVCDLIFVYIILLHIYKCLYMQHVHIYVYICVSICIYTFMCTYTLQVFMCVCVYMCIRIMFMQYSLRPKKGNGSLHLC